MARPGRLTPVILVAGLASAIVATSWGVWHRSGDWLASYWAAKTCAAPDDEVQPQIARIAGIGAPGIPSLVALLGSDRILVRQAARQALWEEMDRWQSLPREESVARRETLVESLACQAGKFSPAARAEAADLADRMLRQPIGDGDGLPPRILTLCEQVCRAAIEGGPTLPLSDPPTPADAVPFPLSSFTPLPGGGLPLDLSPLPDVSPSPPGALPSESAIAPTDVPKPLPEPPSDPRARALRPPVSFANQSGRIETGTIRQ